MNDFDSVLKYVRKTNEKDFNEKLENYNEKFTYAIQSFQATIGNISNKVNEQKDLVNITFLFTLKKFKLNFNE